MKRAGVSFLLAALTAASGAVAVTATPAAAATVIHVAKTGTDTPGCGATSAPCATIPFAYSRFLHNHNAPVNIAGGEVPGGSRDITIADHDMDGEFPVTLVACRTS